MCFLGAFQVASVVKKLPGNVGDIKDMGSIPGSGRSPGGEYANPLQENSWLENLMPQEPGGLQSIWSQRVRHN